MLLDDKSQPLAFTLLNLTFGFGRAAEMSLGKVFAQAHKLFFGAVCIETGFKGTHKIGGSGSCFFLFEGSFAWFGALNLGLDDLLKFFGVGVVEVFGDERLGFLLDKLQSGLDFALADFFVGGQCVVAASTQIGWETHLLQDQSAANRFNDRQMLAFVHDKFGQPKHISLVERRAQQRVGLLAALHRLQIIGFFKVADIDVAFADELLNVDGRRLFGVELVQLLGGEDDVFALLVFVALDDIFPGDFLALFFTDTGVADR